jgi:hypothetical protein
MTKFLLPRWCRVAGLVMFPLSWLQVVARYRWDYSLPFLYHRRYWTNADGSRSNTLDYDITEQFMWIMVIVSLSMIAFARLRKEDEFVRAIRLDSILLSIYCYIVLFIGIVVCSADAGFSLTVLNILPLLLIFIMIFNFRLFVLVRFSKKDQP